jgi:hypothetical protein
LELAKNSDDPKEGVEITRLNEYLMSDEFVKMIKTARNESLIQKQPNKQ